MVLCGTCIGTAKGLSKVISSWDAARPPPPEQELEIYSSDPSQRPLPRDAVQHLSRAELLPQSALRCSFCELIRGALILANIRSRPKDLPIADILGNMALNILFNDPLYCQSPIYLNPIQGNGLYRGSAPKDGYYLQSITPILRPTPYNKTNWNRALDNLKLVAFSDPGTIHTIITSPRFCHTLTDFSETPAGLSGGVSTRKPLDTSCSPEAFRLLNQWLNVCAEEHSGCRRTFSGEELIQTFPCSRIIDVCPPDQPEIPRLVQTNGKMTGRWVALSHCWGEPENCPIVTTKATLHERLKGIRLESLEYPRPKTFIDAVFVTRIIGLRYIWIDSLCIIQDDEDDWEKESAKMGQIYAHAYLTIAASHAYDSRFGCFYKRTYPTNLTTAVSLPFFVPAIAGSGRTEVMERAGSFTVNIAWNYLHKLDVSQCTLGDRGWVTQEWLLSRRMVHCLEDGMVWICKTTAEDETGRNQTETTLWNRSKTWTEIVEEHTMRNLTYEKDRLISIHGLATEMGKSREGDRYFDGLWEKDLPLCLLWKRLPFAIAQRNPEMPNVASWSWASRISSIFFEVSRKRAWNMQDPPVSNLTNFCRIERIEGRALGDRGPPRKAKLWVTSRLKALDDLIIPGGGGEDIPESRRWQIHGDEVLLTARGEEIGWVLFDGGHYCDSPHLQVSTYFLPVIKGTFEGPDWCGGLLLQNSVSAYNEFERVGVAQITDIEWLRGVEEQLVCIV